jgi:hypothetical protein
MEFLFACLLVSDFFVAVGEGWNEDSYFPFSSKFNIPIKIDLSNKSQPITSLAKET